MSAKTPLYNNFGLGAVSEVAAGLVNTDDYKRMLSILENYIPLPVGAFTHRPGTYFVNTGKTNGDKVRMIPYERGSFQNYTIELGDFYMRVYTNSDRIENPPGTPIEVVTPWAKADLFDLQFGQDDDELYVVHRDYAPRLIKRTTDDHTWAVTSPTFTGGPNAFGGANDYPGCIAFWQSRLIFASTHNQPSAVWGSEVGTYLNFQHIGPVFGTATGGDTNTLIDSGGGLSDLRVGALLLDVTNSEEAYVTAITSDTQVETTTKTTTWSGAGYNAVESAYLSDPWEYSIASDRSQTIQWLVGGTALVVGASGGVWTFSRGEEAFGPADYFGVIRKQTKMATNAVQGVDMNARVLYVQKQGKQMREVYYSAETETYAAPELTIYNDEIISAGLTCMDVQNIPSPVLWGVTDDGELVALGYDPTAKMAAWAEMPITGIVESVAVIESGGEDQIWLSIQITIDGTTKRFIVYMKPRDWGTDQADAFFLDNGITLDYGSKETITGATQADPIVITSNSHPFLNDEHVKIEDVVGMTALNGLYYTVKNKAANTFELYNEDGSDGIDGTFFYMNLDSAPAPADFAPGATLTGALSGTTCEVFQKVSSTRYLCRIRSAAFTDGENISDGTNTATGATGYPVVDDVYDTYTSGGTAQQHEKNISGLGHLEDEEVDVVVDGANHPVRTVASGEIVLQEWGNKVHVGHYTSAKARLMRIEAGGDKGPAVGKRKRINNVIVGFHKSVGAKIGPDDDQLTEFKWRDPGQAMDSPPTLFSGFKETTVQGGWTRDGWLEIVQDQPMPQTILSIMPFVETEEL